MMNQTTCKSVRILIVERLQVTDDAIFKGDAFGGTKDRSVRGAQLFCGYTTQNQRVMLVSRE